MKLRLLLILALLLGSAEAYTVRSGDTLASIARRSGVTVSQLMQSNGLRSSTIRVGQSLRIPNASMTVSRIPAAPQRGIFQRGYASYYFGRHDRSTSFVAAHRTLPFGSWVRVTNLNNGRSVNVKINDRGPFIRGRVIDVSNEAASVLGLTRSGVAPVTVSIISRP